MPDDIFFFLTKQTKKKKKQADRAKWSKIFNIRRMERKGNYGNIQAYALRRVGQNCLSWSYSDDMNSEYLCSEI